MKRYCVKRLREQDGILYFTNIFPDPRTVRMCLNSPEPIFEIDVKESDIDNNQPYWGWLDAEDGEIRYVFPAKTLVSACFPYGVKAAEESGQGKMIKVAITEIKQID